MSTSTVSRSPRSGNAVRTPCVAVYSLCAFLGGKWEQIDNYATRRGSDYAMTQMLQRNLILCGELACVPTGELATLPPVQF